MASGELQMDYKKPQKKILFLLSAFSAFFGNAVAALCVLCGKILQSNQL
jgi:hypothetical protein